MAAKKKPVAKTETPKKTDIGQKYTVDEMVNALTKARGMKTLAAKALGCAYNTVSRYINEYPEVAQAALDARENMLDAVELKLFENCMKGDTTALIFTLKTTGRKRGYAEKIDLNIDVNLVTRTIEALEKAGKNPTAIFEKILERDESVPND